MFYNKNKVKISLEYLKYTEIMHIFMQRANQVVLRIKITYSINTIGNSSGKDEL